MGKNYNMSLFDQLKNRIIGKLLLKMNKTFGMCCYRKLINFGVIMMQHLLSCFSAYFLS